MTNQIAIFDADNTLLKYDEALQDWISDNVLWRLYDHDIIYYGDIAEIFKETYHMENLKPLKNAKKFVNYAYENGFDIRVISSISDKYRVSQMRIKNLEDVFGLKFSDYKFFNHDMIFEHKRDYIKQFLDRGAEVYYFEDSYIISRLRKFFFEENIYNKDDLKLFYVNDNWDEIMKELKWD